MTDFTAGKRKFRSSVMDTFTALHVVRRVAPIAGTIFIAAAIGGKINPQQAVLPMMDGISTMKDEDFNFIRDKCLELVQVQDESTNSWFPVFNKNTRTLMYEDIRPRTVVEIVVQVLMENLADFLEDLPQGGWGGSPPKAEDSTQS